jgi:hypothetical protein
MGSAKKKRNLAKNRKRRQEKERKRLEKLNIRR